MREGAPVSIGDLFQAVTALRPSEPAEWDRIAEALGLPFRFTAGDLPSDEDGSSPQAGSPRPTPTTDLPPDGDDEPDGETGASQVPVFAPGHSIEIGDLGLTPTVPDWDPGDTLAWSAAAASPSEVQPLFPRVQARALLTAVALTLAETGELDVDRVIERVARGRPLDFIPRIRRPSSQFGVQILVDRGPMMEPFLEDQRRLTRELYRTVGSHRVHELRFAGVPDRAGPGTRRTWRDYRPPRPGTVVLVLSHLGLGAWQKRTDRGSVEDWVRWGQRLRGAGVRPVGLVLHGPERWPGELSRAWSLVHWSQKTTVGKVRSARGTVR